MEWGAALWPSLRSRRGWRTTDSVPDPALTPGPRSGPQLLEPLERGGVMPAGGWDPAGGPGAPSCPRLPTRRWGAPEPTPRGEQFIPRDPSCPLAAARPPASLSWSRKCLYLSRPHEPPALRSCPLRRGTGTRWREGDMSLSPVMSRPLPHPRWNLRIQRKQKMHPTLP